MTVPAPEKTTRQIAPGDLLSTHAIPELPPFSFTYRDPRRVRVGASGSGRKLRFFLNVRSLHHGHQ